MPEWILFGLIQTVVCVLCYKKGQADTISTYQRGFRDGYNHILNQLKQAVKGNTDGEE